MSRLRLNLLLACAACLLVSPTWGKSPPRHVKMVADRPRPTRAGQDDPLPPGALSRLGGVRLQHGSVVSALAFSADGKTLASGGQYALVSLWDVKRGKGQGRFPLPELSGGVVHLRLSPDGKTVAFTCQDQTIHLWDAKTGKVLHELQWAVRNKGTAPIFAFSPDGQTLASWANDFTIRLWNVKTGKERNRFASVGKRGVKELALAAGAKTLAAAVDDGTIRLWDAPTGKELQLLKGHQYGAYSLAFSANGKQLATGGFSKVRLWDVANGKELHQLPGYDRPIFGVAFAADGKKLTAASDDGDCRVWDTASGKQLRQFSLGTGKGTNSVSKMRFSRGGKLLAWVSWKEHNRVHLTDVATGKDLHPPGPQPVTGGFVFSPDSKKLVTRCEDGKLRVWEAATGKVLRTLEGQPSGAVCLGYAPDGTTIIALGDKRLHFWNAASGKEKRSIARPEARATFQAYACTFSPDGKLLAIGEVDFSKKPTPNDCTIRLWDLGTGKELRTTQGTHRGSVAFLAFAPNSKVLASAGVDRTICLWDVASGKNIRRWQAPGGSGRLAFDEGGKTLLSASSYFDNQGKGVVRIILWNAATGKERRRFEAPGFPSASDGKRLAFTDTSDAIRLWDVAAGKEIRRFKGHQGYVGSVVFAPDGKTLASGSADGTILIWDLKGRRGEGGR